MTANVTEEFDSLAIAFAVQSKKRIQPFPWLWNYRNEDISEESNLEFL
jgi:hypothetical protein